MDDGLTSGYIPVFTPYFTAEGEETGQFLPLKTDVDNQVAVDVVNAVSIDEPPWGFDVNVVSLP